MLFPLLLLNFNRGMSARFTALVTGFPEPEFEFTFKGEPLEPTDRIHIQVNNHIPIERKLIAQ